MKNLFKKSLLVFLLFVSAGVKSQDVDVIHQTISITPSWEKEVLHGETTLLLKMNKASGTLNVDGRFLTIKAVELDGKQVAFEYDENITSSNLKISLGRKLKEDAQIELKIVYQTKWVNETDPQNIWGSLGEGVRFFEPSTTEPKRQTQLWSVGEPNGNGLWFPGVHNTTDKRTTNFYATVQRPLTVLSNGELKNVRDNSDGTRTFHWQTKKAYQSHLTSFVIGKFLPVTQQYKDIEIISYCYPNEADATAATVERLPDMMAYFSEVTGVEYPFSTYSQVFVQEFAGWQANMMTSTITENMVDDWVTHKDFRYLWDIVESEALASQWFGVGIVPKSWEDVWLTKAFARHLSGLYNEYKNGRDEYLSYQFSPQLATYFGDWSNGNIQPIFNPNFTNLTKYVRSNHVYQHGASILHILRKELGDEVWFQVLKAFTRQSMNKSVSTDDLVNVVEQVSQKNMDWFFDQWVYGVGHPIIEVEKEWDSSEKVLTVKLDQLQKWDTLEVNHPTTGFYQGRLWIETDSKTEQVFVEPQMTNSFRIKLAQKPMFVNIDYEGGWVKDLRYEQDVEELIAQLIHSKDITAKIGALNQLGNVARNSSDEDEKLSIYASIRKVILSEDSYWRMKMLALWQLQGLLVSNSPLELDNATEKMLLTTIEDEESWVKSSAVWFLGMTCDARYAQLYIDLFDDWSDRVTNAAAIALGKTKSDLAFDALIELKDKPSWKNQSLISALNGLQWLNDPRGIDLALESLVNNEATHWTLSTPIWDHRLSAGNTLNALGKTDKAFDLIYQQLKVAIDENDLNDVLYNTLQIVSLGNPRGREVFNLLKETYRTNAEVLNAITNLENQFLSKI